jgi:hypothetical protein
MNRISIIFTLFLISISLISCDGANDSSEKKSKNNVDTLSLKKEEIKEEVTKSSIKLFVSTGYNIVDEPCENKVLLFICGDTLRYVSSNCEDEYSIFNYFSSKHLNLSATGDANLIDNCGGGDPAQIMCMNNSKHKVKLSNDSTKLEIDGQKFKASTIRQFFKSDKFDIYEAPSFNSKLITKSHKGSYPIISISKFEKNGKEFGVWYKLLKDNKEVWTFGSSFCTNY